MTHSAMKPGTAPHRIRMSRPSRPPIVAARESMLSQYWLATLMLCVLATSAGASSGQLANFGTQNDQPWVVMVTQPGCSFCERLEREILQPLRASGQFAGRIRFSEVDIGVNPTIIDFNGEPITSVDFAKRYQAFGTPTLLFLSASGEELSPPRYGVPDAIDFYAYAIEQTITAILQPVTSR
jgi:hypothetical protein